MVDNNIVSIPGLVAPVRRRLYTVRTAKELMAVWGVCFAIYGPPGSGKSTLAGQAVDSVHAGKVGVVDIEGGARALGDREDIDIFSIFDSDANHDNGMGFSAVEQVLDDLISGYLKPSTGEPKYGTIILDNVSELNAYCTYDTLRTVPRKIDQQDRPDQKDWNTTTSRMLQLVRRWRDFAQASGTNVMFIAWDKAQEDRVTGVNKKDIAFNPALANQFPGLIDIVAYLTINSKGKRTLSFEASASTAAKFRRSPTETAMTIPGEFVYEFASANRPMKDLIDCLKGGIPFPAANYAKANTVQGDRGGAAAASGAKLTGAEAVAAAIRGQ